MADPNHVTIVGNVTRDPELKYSNNGKAFMRLGIAQTPRKKSGDGWVDGDAMYFDVTVFGQMAEHIAESISKGMRVVVTGRAEYRSWTTESGEKRTTVSFVADEVAPSLLFGTVTYHKGGGNGAGRAPASTPAADAGHDPYSDEEPF